jgi:AraC family transcriptional regulator
MAMRVDFLNELSDHFHLRIRSMNEMTQSSDWVESKAHQDYDLWLIREGAVCIRSGRHTYTAYEGELVFFCPGMVYTASTSGSGCKFAYVHFDFGISEQNRLLDAFKLFGVVPGMLAHKEKQLFLDALDKSRSAIKPQGIRYYLSGCFSILIAKIIEVHGSGSYTGQFPQVRTRASSGGGLEALQPTLKFIHENLHRSLRIQEIAALAAMSEKYFISRFRQSVGVTPNQYIYRVKMNKARDYLYQGRYSVHEIAGLLGYPDPFAFSKAFKKFYGVAPSRFV